MEDAQGLPSTIIDALGALPPEASADARAAVVAGVLETRFKAVSHVGDYRTFLREVGVPKSVARKLAPSFANVAGEPATTEDQKVSISNMLQAIRAVAEDLQASKG